jgi:pSer/pThr/pTyr-binding forkhead associated (FHA) protein
MHAQLVPVDGGSPITLTRDIIVVGRKRGLCDLVIDKTSISKLHSMLVKTDGLLFVRDLGSTNGTKVNGQRVVRGALLPGDQLSFASIRFKVKLGPDRPSDEPVKSNEVTEMIPMITEDDLDDSSFDGFDLGASNSDVRLDD